MQVGCDIHVERQPRFPLSIFIRSNSKFFNGFITCLSDLLSTHLSLTKFFEYDSDEGIHHSSV